MEPESGRKLEVTWGRAVAVWWGCLWRLLVLAAGPSLAFASVSGGLVAFLFVPSFAGAVWWFFFVCGTALLSIPVVKWVLDVVLFDGFAVRLVPVAGEAAERVGTAEPGGGAEGR